MGPGKVLAMNRRAFLTGLVATAGGLLLPHEPRRVYSFGERVGRIRTPEQDGRIKRFVGALHAEQVEVNDRRTADTSSFPFAIWRWEEDPLGFFGTAT